MNENYRFLSEEDILYIHNNQINLYGGESGIRSQELLNSAVSHVRTEFAGVKLYKNLIEIASAYIYHICQNHCFIDGNKRTALVAGLVFLNLNGFDILDPEEKLYQMMLDITEGKIGKSEIQKILGQLAN